MTLIQHLESAYGTFVPKKGMVSITESLYGLAKRLGVKFSFETVVKEIKVELGVISGIKTKSGSFSSDYVISNMDVFHTYKKLLPNEILPISRLKQERSSSAVIFYWGIKQSFPDLDLHNIFFSKNYKKEFQAIFKDKTVSEDPTIYINITSKEVVGDAPKGCENWFIMINTPADHGQDWTQIVNRLRSHIITNISKRLNVNLKNLIVCEEVLTPPDIESKTQSYMGALYGASSNDTMAAFLRHPNFSNRIKNLYFCGGSVHPGGGIPLCLLSAKIVDELMPAK
jgi:phytoene desaturase